MKLLKTPTQAPSNKEQRLLLHLRYAARDGLIHIEYQDKAITNEHEENIVCIVRRERDQATILASRNFPDMDHQVYLGNDMRLIWLDGSSSNKRRRLDASISSWTAWLAELNQPVLVNPKIGNARIEKDEASVKIFGVIPEDACISVECPKVIHGGDW